jgi:hypothetical protein
MAMLVIAADTAAPTLPKRSINAHDSPMDKTLIKKV